MTQNQLKYWENQERERSNLAQEEQKRKELDQKKTEFNRSNWHQAVSNVGRGAKGVADSVTGLFNPIRQITEETIGPGGKVTSKIRRERRVRK